MKSSFVRNMGQYEHLQARQRAACGLPRKSRVPPNIWSTVVAKQGPLQHENSSDDPTDRTLPGDIVVDPEGKRPFMQHFGTQCV